MHRLFVYGSLKRGFQNHVLLTGFADTRFVGTATTEECFKMVGYKDGSFPYVLRASAPLKVSVAYIQGELFEVGDACLRALDTLEGHPTFYTRTRIQIDGAAAYMYVIEEESVTNSIRGELGTTLTPIPTGVWNP